MVTTAVLRSHDALNNRMHLDAFSPSPPKPRRRRHAKLAAVASPPPKMAAVNSPAPKTAVMASSPPKMAVVNSPLTAASTPVKVAAPGRRSPPARPARKQQTSPTKEKPKQRLVMEEVRILKRGEEVPAPAPTATPVPVPAPVDRRVLISTSRTGKQEPAVRAPTPVIPAGRIVKQEPAVRAPTPVDQRLLFSTSRIGPQKPAVVPAKIVAGTASAGYAGSVCSAAAPEPSCLPVPGFIRRAEVEATRGLRCLLRIGEL